MTSTKIPNLQHDQDTSQTKIELQTTRTLYLVWMFLVGATFISWWLATNDEELGSSGQLLANCGVLIMAFVKVRLVGLYFMDLSNAVRSLRIFFEAWMAIVGIALLMTYVLS